jgi:uncharacterized membrane protein
MSPKLSAPLLWLYTVVISAAAADELPERVPVHWDLHGNPDGWGSKWQLLLLGPGLVFFIGGLLIVLERVDPRLRREDDPRPRRSLMNIALVLLALMHTIFLAHVAGLLTDLNRALTLCLSLSLMLMGNILTRVRPNTFAGIRTPWTLSSDSVWRRTHRFGGHALFAAGLAASVGALALPTAASLVVALVLLLGASLAAVIYSYVVWRGEQHALPLPVCFHGATPCASPSTSTPSSSLFSRPSGPPPAGRTSTSTAIAA